MIEGDREREERDAVRLDKLIDVTLLMGGAAMIVGLIGMVVMEGVVRSC